MARNVYHVEYNMFFADKDHGIDVIASNKVEAWDKATYEAIPAKEGGAPYAAWVTSVTYQNGNYHTFHTFSGKPY